MKSSVKIIQDINQKSKIEYNNYNNHNNNNFLLITVLII